MRVLAALCIAAAATPCGAVPNDPNDRDLLVKLCSPCHSMNGYVPSDRSEKSWQLTVERMRNYVNPDDDFSEEHARRITRYLASFPDNEMIDVDESVLQMAWQQPQPAEPAAPNEPAGPTTASAPTTSPAPATAPPGPSHAPGPTPNRAVAISRPGPALGVAKLAGYVGAAVLWALIFTGVTRQMTGTYFRGTHICLAIVLACCVVIHSAVFLAEYGAPQILWFWFGVAALLVVFAAVIGGALRRRIGGLLFRLHKAGALVGLALTVLHWVWYYM